MLPVYFFAGVWFDAGVTQKTILNTILRMACQYLFLKMLKNILFFIFLMSVNTDELVHTARSSSAHFPVFQCTLSAA